MCGILGWVRSSDAVDIEKLGRGTIAIAHRGPDDWGFAGGASAGSLRLTREVEELRGASIVLAHRRLSIIDLTESGWQPMSTADGRFTLVFNGEIYNYRELREELQRAGVEFHSHCDSEVLLLAMAHWGRAALSRFIGMFAFALWDAERSELMLARDPFGIKPLYFTSDTHGVTFASELKALREMPGVSSQVNARRLHRYLTIGQADDGQETMLRGAHQVPAAHLATFRFRTGNVAEVQRTRYWSLTTDATTDLSFEEAAAGVRDRFLDSIRLHLRSDVPLGAALSGGIDSSAIVCAMRAVDPNLEIHAFSYVADDPRISEERWVELVGSATGAVVHKTGADERALIAELDHLIDVQDEPFGSTSIYAQHRVFRLAREAGITVMLDGQGADEMLAGYSNFLGARLGSLARNGEWARLARLWRSASALPHVSHGDLLAQAGGRIVPQWARPAAKALLHRTRNLAPGWLNEAWFAERGAVVAPPMRTAPPHLMRNLLADSVEQGLLTLLRYEDRNSMAYSIESRVPFLTVPLAEFLFSLPEEYILSSGATSKSVFREAMRGIVPDPILDRRDKIGFSTPELQWLSRARDWVDGILGSPAAERVQALNTSEMRREWSEIQAGRSPFNWRVWRWINLIRWADRWDVQFD